MLLRKTKIFCNGCQRASEVTVPVATEQDEVTQESLTCARPGHDLAGRKAGLGRNDTSVLEMTHEEQRAAASFGYGTPSGTKAAKERDMTAWHGEINAALEEIEAARPQPTPEQAQMARDATKRIVDAYPLP